MSETENDSLIRAAWKGNIVALRAALDAFQPNTSCVVDWISTKIHLRHIQKASIIINITASDLEASNANQMQ